MSINRRGASVVEILGCVIALVAGVALGANYLGVDLRGVCASALKSADVEAPEWLADAEQAVDLVEANETETVPTSTEVADETGDATNPDAAAGQQESDQQDAAEAESPRPVTVEEARARRRDALGYLVPLTDEQKVVLTHAYWTELLEIIAEEEESRRACIGDACNLQLFDYLSSRRAAHAKAAEAITELSTDGVDAHVTTYSSKILSWHQEGESLFGRAISLLTDAPTAQLTGPFAQSWQSAATQHRMEERLLIEKRAAVQSFLEHNLPTVPLPAADDAAASDAP